MLRLSLGQLILTYLNALYTKHKLQSVTNVCSAMEHQMESSKLGLTPIPDRLDTKQTYMGNTSYCIHRIHHIKNTTSVYHMFEICLIFIFFNWYSPHARLNSHYEAWSYKKRSTKRITGYRKSV